MIWRVVAVLVVIFWASMSSLLLREIYFPESSRFAAVPPRLVLEMFLRQSESLGNTLHLYHRKEKIGHATFQLHRRIQPNNRTAYDVQARGVVDEAVPGTLARRNIATWNFASVLLDAETWRRVNLEVELPVHTASLKLSWDANHPSPEVLVKQGDRVVLNSQDVQVMLKMGSGSNSALAMLSMLQGQNGVAVSPSSLQKAPDLNSIHAREGIMLLAGRERKCYVLVLPVIGDQEVKMIFTEAGELARIDLPDDYSLLEPMVFGLQG